MKAMYYGIELSKQEIEWGKVSYATFAKALDASGGMILCNQVVEVANKLGDDSFWENWENYGIPVDEDGNECDLEECVDVYYPEIYQYFIVGDNVYTHDLLSQAKEPYTYFEPLDCLVLGVTHFGTPWSGVSTCIEISADTKGMLIYK